MIIYLKNSEKKVRLCNEGIKLLKAENLLDSWRLHSAGYAVYQYLADKKMQTIYLHKLLAQRLVPKPEGSDSQKLFVHFLNGDKSDCQIQNLEWVTMGELRRRQNRSFGFRGVSKDGKKYRAVLYDAGERVYLGIFDSETEAAQAYNRESEKRFGRTKSLNKLQ